MMVSLHKETTQDWKFSEEVNATMLAGTSLAQSNLLRKNASRTVAKTATQSGLRRAQETNRGAHWGGLPPFAGRGWAGASAPARWAAFSRVQVSGGSDGRSLLLPAAAGVMAGQAFRKFLPLFDRVLVERSAAETNHKESLCFQKNHREKYCKQRWQLLDQALKERVEIQPVSVKVGDKVLLPEYGGTKVVLDDKDKK